MKKTLNILLNASFYYVVIRSIVWLTQFLDREVAEFMNYHYSNNLLWYLVWFFIPIVTSILISINNQNKYLKQVGVILLPLIILGTSYGAYKNYNYWGYCFKRPVVFNELKKGQELFSVTNFTREDENRKFKVYHDSTLRYDYESEDLYYLDFS